MNRDVDFLQSFIVALVLVGASQRAHSSELTDEELVERQARIGRIVIEVDDVFETDEPLAAPYRFVNKLHIDSRPATIAAQLLFRSGDLFDRRVLDESERNLRAQRYLNAATIAVTRYDSDLNTVDLEVRVHDVWTLSPGISFGRKGGTNATRLELEESNLLGFGKRLELWRSQDVDRTSSRLRYIDPNVLGSRWQLSTAYVSSSDGGEKTIDVERPFYSLDARWSAGALATDVTTGVTRYRLGDLVEQFDMRKRLLDVSGGVSAGRKDGQVRRLLGGVRYDGREFSLHRNEPATLPADRVVSYPWIGFEVLEDKYLETRNLDQIGRTEDIHLGWFARLDAGYASPAFNSTQSAFVLNGAASFGGALSDRQYFFSDVLFQSRLEEGELRNAIVDIANRYYFRHNAYSVFFASAVVALTSDLDPERQLTLGGDNGLRGYPLRYQGGTRYTLLTLEERFYTGWQPLKLFDVGAAVFFDAGRTWGNDPFAGESLGVLKNVGFGLRLGNARSALGNVLHVDLAFPLDGRADVSKMQLVVETRRSF